MIGIRGKRRAFESASLGAVAAVLFFGPAGGGIVQSGDVRSPELQGLELTKLGDDGKIQVHNKKLGPNQALYVPASQGAGTPALLQVRLSSGSTVTVALRMLQKIPNDKGPWENSDIRTPERPWGSYRMVRENGVVTGTITIRFDKNFYGGNWKYQVRDHKLARLDIGLDNEADGSGNRNRTEKVEQTVRPLVTWMIADYGSREPGGLPLSSAIENPEYRDGDYRGMAVLIDGKYVASVSAQRSDGSYRQADGLSLLMGLRNSPFSLEQTPDDDPVAGGHGPGTLATAAWSRVQSDILGPDGSDPGGVCFKVSPNVNAGTSTEISLATAKAKRIAAMILPGKGETAIEWFITAHPEPRQPVPLVCPTPTGSMPTK